MPKKARAPDERIEWLKAMPFLLIMGTVALPFFTSGVTWELVALCVASYYLRMFAVTAGYHRYFSHRAFRTSRAFQFVLAVLAQSSAQKGALWWAANHRHHHQHSDTDEDVHSPVKRGFLWSHMGWILVKKYEGTDLNKVKDLARYPELVFLNKWHLLPPVAYGFAILLIWGWSGLLWGMFISTALLWHGTFFINSLAHVAGRRRYETADTSKNNFVLAVLTCGEGWHNNHHHYQSSANQGFFWWEIDVSFYLLKLLSWVGLVWDLRTPPRQVIDGIDDPTLPATKAVDSVGLALPAAE
jgi:stearoyl-CoA desaturase (delta-9 desaturase)